MLSSYLVCKVLEVTNITKVVYASVSMEYSYTKVIAEIHDNMVIDCYISSKLVSKELEGSYLEISKAVLTALDYEVSKSKRKSKLWKLAFRIHDFEVVSEEYFKLHKDNEVHINLIVSKRAKDQIAFRGVERKPFMTVFGTFYNEESNIVSVRLVSKYKQAFKFNDLPERSHLDITGILKPGLKDKNIPVIYVTDVIFRKEVGKICQC